MDAVQLRVLETVGTKAGREGLVVKEEPDAATLRSIVIDDPEVLQHNINTTRTQRTQDQRTVWKGITLSNTGPY